MYQYNELDQQLIDQRVEQFRDQVRRYRAGEIGEDEFKALRLRNGLYLQTHAYMLRVAIPYGLLSGRQLHMLAHVARTYDRDYGHFTTRQNIQYNWPELDRVPDLLADLASVQMHAIQTSGNVVRNITSDPLAGVSADEIEDPRPYCELLRQWSTLHPEFNWLPRKFKIAITGASEDRTAVAFHDIGLRIVRNAAGETGFKVLVGGGMGRAPHIGKVIREFLPREHLLSYVEAILRVYNLHGRRDNIHRARIKILVNAMGLERFAALVDEEWAHIRESTLALTEDDIARMAAHFQPPEYLPFDGDDGGTALLRRSDASFGAWLRQNTRRHKQAGYRVVFVSLKKTGVAPGDMTSAQMDRLADLAERYSFGQLRTTHEQNLVLADVREHDLPALWRALDEAGLASANIGTLQDMIVCPGLDYCSLANAYSLPVANAIAERFEDLDYLYDLGDLQLKMSGCMNACGHHHVGHIGILGVEKHGESWYQFTLGGSPGDDAALGTRLGASVPQARVPDVVADILAVYLDLRQDNERFLDTYRRVGITPFREKVYANPQGQSVGEQPVAALA